MVAFRPSAMVYFRVFSDQKGPSRKGGDYIGSAAIVLRSFRHLHSYRVPSKDLVLAFRSTSSLLQARGYALLPSPVLADADFTRNPWPPRVVL